MKHLYLILLLATCPACTVGYQGLLDDANINPNVATSPDTGTATHPNAPAIDAMSPDAQTGPDVDAAELPDSDACVPAFTTCTATAPGRFTQQYNGCSVIDCALSKECSIAIPDGATACVVSACPACTQGTPCCSTTTYGACSCTFGTTCGVL